jgi:hypothetical protein
MEKWKCLECGKNFGRGEWECFPGSKHVVEPKTYYLLDAPFDPSGTSFRKSRTTVHNVPPERVVNDSATGQSQRIPGGWVEFVRGCAVVTDPEQQYWLEKNGYGKVTKEQWEKVYFSDSEKQAMREAAIKNKEAEAQKKLQQANELLAMAEAKSSKK